MEPLEVTGSPYDQHGFGVRFDWGLEGLGSLASEARLVLLVDVLSFSTCVDIATSRGATVLPFAPDGLNASRYAEAQDAVLAGGRSGDRHAGEWSLSPASLLSIPTGTRIVLPSPNGSTPAAEASRLGPIVIAGCLRNAVSVAAAANRVGPPIVVIAAGERWGTPDGHLRPAVEDLLGAGAIIAQLDARLSPEAEGAAAAFDFAQSDLLTRMRESASGRELIAAGFSDDVELAAALETSDSVPTLHEGAFADRPQRESDQAQ